MNIWWSTALALVGGLMLLWLLALAALALVLPRGNLLTEAIRLLPDLLRLIPRLARDHTLPRGVRVRLWLLLGYLAMPIDLVPDFIPVLGYADDAIVIAAVLRSVVRHAGPEALARHWPGTDDGLSAIRRLADLPATRT
ncbi:YkvA family protein [Streptomyces sp. NPDC007907]|uniref:YkvA family protein n=1 Tax=Streptomyces sp. NPDC007907 TaxID=3364789 RepID=UPI0036F0E0B8